MRCYQARRKLTALFESGRGFAEDRALLEHLQGCSACAREADAAIAMRADFDAARANDLVETVPMSVLRNRVEAHATSVNREVSQENSLMQKILRPIKERPGFGVGIAVVTVIVALSMLIPFKYDRTIGYEVAFGAVDRSLAMDSEKLHLILERVGVSDAVLDVSDCTATCKLVVSDLKSPQDVQLVVAALNEVVDVKLDHEVKPICELAKGSVITVVLAGATIDPGDFEADEVVTHVVIERLGADFDEGDVVWYQSNDCIGIGEDVQIGEMTFELDENGNVPPEVLAELRAGCPSADPFGLNGGCRIIELKITDSAGLFYVTENDSSAPVEVEKAEPGALPEGFELSQNYPNPFNPTTTIDYALPDSRHVSLQVINTNGQVVRTLVDGTLGAGRHSVEWDATTDGGSPVASGVYFYRLQAGDVAQTKKMSFIK